MVQMYDMLIAASIESLGVVASILFSDHRYVFKATVEYLEHLLVLTQLATERNHSGGPATLHEGLSEKAR